MSAESLYLHNPELAKTLDEFVKVMDATDRKDAPIVLFRPRFKEFRRRTGLSEWKGHPVKEGPPTHRRAKRPKVETLL